jgi:hypothetical protein
VFCVLFLFARRTDNQIKNRYYSTMRRLMRKSERNAEPPIVAPEAAEQLVQVRILFRARVACPPWKPQRRLLPRAQRLRTQLDEFTDDSGEVKSFSSGEGEDAAEQQATDGNKKRPGSAEATAESVNHAKRLRDALV